MGELAASLAHEISQPLTAILSNAQAAQRFLNTDSPNIAEVRDILADIVDDNRRAGEVIRRLRGFLKRSAVELQPLNLNQVIREVVRLLSNEAMLRNVTIALTLDPILPPVRGDRIQLQQVVLNLMLNGFDSMAELMEGDRRLLVRTQRASATSIQTAVQDCGGGLEKDKLERIFDPFFTTKPDGMGMGLSICQSIIQTHGGHLWAMTNPDRGLTFCFTLPVKNQEEHP
jgi:two-component system sensor kinase FixL